MAPSDAILAVDCDPAALGALVAVLRQGGYQTTGASTFESARQWLRTGHYDLLMTEVRLKAFNGLHLVMHGRAVSRAMAAIVLTHVPDAAIECEAHQLGARYVVKPIEPAALLQVVRETLREVREEVTA